MGGHADAGHRDWADGVSKGEGGEREEGGGEALHIERNEWKGYGSWFGSTHFQGWGVEWRHRASSSTQGASVTQPHLSGGIAQSTCPGTIFTQAPSLQIVTVQPLVGRQ